MIRAVLRNGVIEPTDPLPASWSDGHEVLITDASGPEQDAWYREMEAEAAQMDPRDGDRLMSALVRAHEEAKELARSELKLP